MSTQPYLNNNSKYVCFSEHLNQIDLHSWPTCNHVSRHVFLHAADYWTVAVGELWLPSAVQQPVPAVAAQLSAGQRLQPEWLLDAGFSSWESAAGLASGGKALLAQGRLSEDRKQWKITSYQQTVSIYNKHDSFLFSTVNVGLQLNQEDIIQTIFCVKTEMILREMNSINTPGFCACPMGTLIPGSVVTPDTTAGTDTTGGLVRVTWAVCPAWAWIWPCAGPRACETPHRIN